MTPLHNLRTALQDFYDQTLDLPDWDAGSLRHSVTDLTAEVCAALARLDEQTRMVELVERVRVAIADREQVPFAEIQSETGADSDDLTAATTTLGYETWMRNHVSTLVKAGK